MKLLAIDPGPERSAFLAYDTTTSQLLHWEKADNPTVLDLLDTATAHELVIEMIASYGMPVGAEVFETCVWVGRFIQAWQRWPRPPVRRVTRVEVKAHLCHSARATDANIRQALIDRHGPGKEWAIGRKQSPGVLYGLKGDGWSALAVAITAAETMLDRDEPTP